MSAMKGFQLKDMVVGFPAWSGFIDLEKQAGVATITLRVVYGKVWRVWCSINTGDTAVMDKIAELFKTHFRVKDLHIYRDAERKTVLWLDIKSPRLHFFLAKFNEIEEDLALLSIWG